MLESLKDDYSSIKFVKVDVDQVGEAAEQFAIRAMPTVHFVK